MAAILLGLLEQLDADGKLDLHAFEIGPTDDEPMFSPVTDPVVAQDIEDAMVAVDDVNGGSLDPTLVRAARLEEITWMKNRPVYEKVPIAAAKGKVIIPALWVDTNKGDDEHPDYRSRPCC